MKSMINEWGQWSSDAVRTSTDDGLCRKLVGQWQEPYTVMGKIDAVTYKLTARSDKYVSAHIKRMRKFRP